MPKPDKTPGKPPHVKRRDFYLDTLRVRYAAMTPRQRRRLWRQDAILEIALRHLVDEGLI